LHVVWVCDGETDEDGGVGWEEGLELGQVEDGGVDDRRTGTRVVGEVGTNDEIGRDLVALEVSSEGRLEGPELGDQLLLGSGRRRGCVSVDLPDEVLVLILVLFR